MKEMNCPPKDSPLTLLQEKVFYLPYDEHSNLPDFDIDENQE